MMPAIEDPTAPVNATQSGAGGAELERYMATQVIVMKSDPILRRALEERSVKERTTWAKQFFNGGTFDSGEAIKKLRKIVSARAVPASKRAALASAATRAPSASTSVKAFSADPDDWRTLFRYVLLASPYVRKLSENDLDVLLRAYQLAPQVAEIGITTAVALAQADRLVEAATVLEPIAHAAHGGELPAYAAKALDRAVAGDRAGFLALFGGPMPEAD